jgi:predicted NAD/FAD-binding protein
VDLPLPSSPKGDGQAVSTLPVDTGFIVYNQRTYPNLTALFNQLQVPTQASDMSFAVSLQDNINPRRGLEYSSHPRALLGQIRNWCQPGYAGMLRDLLRLYRLAPQDAGDPRFAEMTLGQYVAARGFGQWLLTDHLIPMTAAIWSMPAASTLDFPLPSFMRFCPEPRPVAAAGSASLANGNGGSRNYVQRLLADCPRLNLRLNQPVQRVMRLEQGVQITTAHKPELFDQVIFAVHGAQILPLLTNPSGREQAVLSAFRTQANQAILHHDPRLMPRRRLAWAAWNVLAPYQQQPTPPTPIPPREFASPIG